MKRHATCCAAVAVAALLTLNPTAWAMQEPMPQDPTRDAPRETDPRPAPTATGELQEIDGETMTLRVKAADETVWTFRYTTRTVIVGSQQGVAGLATTESVLVTVHYEEAEGERIATRIDVDERR